MRIIKPPSFATYLDNNSVFLAGSIEMDTASNWQEKVQEALNDTEATVYNPRRDNWDSSWKQEANDKNFREQVEWELRSMYNAGVVAMYFDPATKSPVTLLELGLLASSKKLIVCCPEGFWRKGNVDIVCERYKVPTVKTLEKLIKVVRKKLNETKRNS